MKKKEKTMSRDVGCKKVTKPYLISSNPECTLFSRFRRRNFGARLYNYCSLLKIGHTSLSFSLHPKARSFRTGLRLKNTEQASGINEENRQEDQVGQGGATWTRIAVQDGRGGSQV